MTATRHYGGAETIPEYPPCGCTPVDPNTDRIKNAHWCIKVAGWEGLAPRAYRSDTPCPCPCHYRDTRHTVTANRTVGSCAACGTRFTAATGGRGRPRVTCSDPCRTAYEAVQRAVKALDAIETARPHSRARAVRRLAELLTDAG